MPQDSNQEPGLCGFWSKAGSCFGSSDSTKDNTQRARHRPAAYSGATAGGTSKVPVRDSRSATRHGGTNNRSQRERKLEERRPADGFVPTVFTADAPPHSTHGALSTDGCPDKGGSPFHGGHGNAGYDNATSSGTHAGGYTPGGGGGHTWADHSGGHGHFDGGCVSSSGGGGGHSHGDGGGGGE
ncbi:hypothetical protein I302_104151 [Kwoniella bestiolae CBS 10118]|uniref:Uncharacterized protein n=1 Tax=Kwoniella bestiolae CBS 10118 TaxID=1296100 RepID=A0A1B9GAG7_9TREE|nr:hypothetical protein I302_02858 [Kwoniella bestiolae CBS 10118]OCF28007.1 hypothetical protein I302_02858 [Kwoniella bestiolae CBS 10118]